MAIEKQTIINFSDFNVSYAAHVYFNFLQQISHNYDVCDGILSVFNLNDVICGCEWTFRQPMSYTLFQYTNRKSLIFDVYAQHIKCLPRVLTFDLDRITSNAQN